MNLEFLTFWTALPPSWKVGMLAAQGGQAFRGDLVGDDGQPSVAVFFVHPALADKVEAFMERGQ